MYLTGIFPHCSASGHEYLLVGYNYDVNSIFVEPLLNSRKNIADGLENINQQIKTSVVQPHTYVLYNEVYNTLKKFFEKYTVNYQLVPPHSYQAKNQNTRFRYSGTISRLEYLL